jgi:putative membrane-bound dehydrogenase-like protein
MKFLFVFSLFGIWFIFGCQSKSEVNQSTTKTDQKSSLDSAARHSAQHALDGFDVLPGYELSLFAAEPMLQNPTNMDIDHRGRVYITEAYNYRPQISGVATKFEGDRIMILEDTNGDGKADVSKVFYQGPEINAPLGICVIGSEVIVSQSPFVWKFTDTDGDDKADKKEILFQGIKGIQDDHGVHSFALGPDGRYYFTMGNSSKTIFDAKNKLIRTIQGTPMDEDHFMQGLILRGNLDGTGFEVVGQNFRNNYECAVDAYGNIWQTDNDDDGNRGTRLNYVLEYGKYGYRDELTNADWRAYRANLEDSIPLRHWHQNDPGVVPNVLQLGSGSPCGLMAYEGDLIPELKGSLLHAEALHNVIRAYTPKSEGASVTASQKDIIKQKDDSWFRPCDITAAPDGSIFIADWYDPGVGGHYAGDQMKGRVYRLAPKGIGYKVPVSDVTAKESLPGLLASPNLSTRSMAQLALRKLGKDAIPLLEPLIASKAEGTKARALWILSAIDPSYALKSLKDPNDDIKIAALRMARQHGTATLSQALQTVVADNPSPKLAREAAIALSQIKSTDWSKHWLALASNYKGGDRWTLEALGIAADTRWDQIMPAFLASKKDFIQDLAAKDIIWRSRSKASVAALEKIVLATQGSENLRYIRAYDFVPAAAKNQSLLRLLKSATDPDLAMTIIRSLDPMILSKDSEAREKLTKELATLQGEPYLDLVDRFLPKSEIPKLESLWVGESDPAKANRIARSFVKLGGISTLESLYQKSADSIKIRLIQTLGGLSTPESIQLLQKIIDSKPSEEIISEAYKNIGRGWNGEEYVVKALAQDKIPKEYQTLAVQGLLNAWRKPMRAKAQEILAAQAQVATPYKVDEMIKESGSVENGKAVFAKNCSSCHKVSGTGADFGPPLDEIGSKYGKDGLYTSILEPSKAINFGYEGIQIVTNNGGIYVGIKANETADELTIKMAGGGVETIYKKNIKERIDLHQSLMTPYLYQTLSRVEMIDLVEYLTTLKKPL